MKSVLAVQLKRLGDLILTTPALVALRQTMPQARITLLIDRYSEELAPALPMVDEIFTYDRRRSLPIWLKLLFREYDYCLDFTGNDRSALVAFFPKQRTASVSALSRVGAIAPGSIRIWFHRRSATFIP